MVLVVNYSDLDIENKTEISNAANRLINRLVESNIGTFLDIRKYINLNVDNTIPSLEFTVLKSVFEDEISKIETNVVLDGLDLLSAISNLDFFQQNFLNKLLESFGRIDIHLIKSTSDCPTALCYNNNIKYCYDKDFFVDFEEKLKKELSWFESNSIQSLIKALTANGYYLGNCNLKNISSSYLELVILSGNPGQSISYEEYSKWILEKWNFKDIQLINYSDLDLDRYVFVRQHHPIELIAKKMFSKTKKVL